MGNLLIQLDTSYMTTNQVNACQLFSPLGMLLCFVIVCAPVYYCGCEVALGPCLDL